MTLANPNPDSVLSAPDAPATELPELLTWEEICRRYPKEWVILVDTVHRELVLAGGRVFAHSTDKHALVPAGHEAMRRYGRAGRFFTGIKLTWKIRSYAQRNV